MQQKEPRRSNRERSDATRTAILDAHARSSSPEATRKRRRPDIVAAAGLTRGALYHTSRQEGAVSRDRRTGSTRRRGDYRAIGRCSPPTREPLLRRSGGYFDAMAVRAGTPAVARRPPCWRHRNGGSRRRPMAQNAGEGLAAAMTPHAWRRRRSRRWHSCIGRLRPAALEIDAGADGPTMPTPSTG